MNQSTNPDHMNNLTDERLIDLAKMVLQAVDESGPLGAPSGPMYLAFMQAGMTLDSYTQLTAGIQRLGFMTKRGDCFYITPAGKAFIS